MGIVPCPSFGQAAQFIEQWLGLFGLAPGHQPKLNFLGASYHHIGNVPEDDAMALDVLFAIAFLSATVLFGFLASKPRDTAFLIVGGFMLTAIGAVWLFI